MFPEDILHKALPGEAVTPQTKIKWSWTIWKTWVTSCTAVLLSTRYVWVPKNQNHSHRAICFLSQLYIVQNYYRAKYDKLTRNVCQVSKVWMKMIKTLKGTFF
jgi:hypothetical protein